MLIVTRHGESVANAEDWFAGQIDAPLTDKGREQARALGQYIAEQGWRFDHVFASDLSRAFETAEIALEHSRLNDHFRDGDAWRVQKEIVLRERHAGDMAGVVWSEAEAIHGKDTIQNWFRTFDNRPPGGESVAQVTDRVRDFLRQFARPLIENQKCVFVACHGIVLKGFLVALRQETPDTAPTRPIHNTETFVFDRDTVLTGDY